MRLREHCATWLMAWGLLPRTHASAHPSWGSLIIHLLIVPDPEGKPLRERLALWYPHIDWYNWRPGDVLRFLLQTIWLIVMQPKTLATSSCQPRPSAKPSHLENLSTIGSQTWRQVNDRVRGLIVRWIPAWLEPERMRTVVDHAAQHTLWNHPLAATLLYLVAAFLVFLCITTPFTLSEQALFVALLWGVALLIQRIPGPTATFMLIMFSITVSTRYMWWRINDTINFNDTTDLIIGSGLLVAETYAWLLLLLGYFQTAWALKRKPEELPADFTQWPIVDVFIPIYNEPLRVLEPTVFGALGLDWPKDKLNVWVLDDGHRDEIRDFAATVGARYLRRAERKHAKAGNINHALGHAQGEFVAIFDCDHIPTRSFLQVTMGGFLLDAKLALVQTPHHFFSADPFERNLHTTNEVPPEGELFYGRVQDGNDLWNAAFFCGSCAVLRRTALNQIGGIAVETVTEDAHTSLKMHRMGWHSSYINIPQAAGLATESLGAHIGQRIRWARGMTQIFRMDNPMLGPGLTLAQRLCYTNAMLHFLYGLPRLVFLTAPLAFLLFHVYTIYAPALAIFLYVLPHVAFATLTNSRMHGTFRRSFWGEIYETVLAWYISIPTTIAMIMPSKGKFNVTAKGGLIEKDYFDWGISLPYVVLMLLNLLGLVVAMWRLASGPTNEFGTVIINCLWTLYNMLLLGVAIAVAKEVRQVRIAHRIEAHLPAILYQSDGSLLACSIRDYSSGGMSLILPTAQAFVRNTRLTVAIASGGREYAFPVQVVFSHANKLSLQLDGLSLQQQIDWVHCTFARADAWIKNKNATIHDRPLKGLRDIVLLGVTGLRELGVQCAALVLPLWHSRLAHIVGSYLPRHPLITVSDPS